MWFENFTVQALNAMTAKSASQRPRGVLLGYAAEAPHVPITWPDVQRCEHLVIAGKTGTGKTTLLELMAMQLAGRGEGFSFFDFHGDASLSLIRRLLNVTGAAERLVIIDPSHPTRSPGINVLEADASDAERFRKVSELSSILRQRWGVDSFGARTEELLRNSLYTLAASGNTLADLARLLTDPTFRRACTDRVDHPDIALYWRDRYEPLTEPMKAVFREPLLNKVTAFLTEPAARHLLSQRVSTVDVSDVMRNGKWLIVRLPKGRLREHAHTLGNLLFAQLQFAALAREAVPISARHTFTLLCDEVQNLAENDLATLLTEGRKFRISVVTANQFWEQLPRELRGALLSAASHVFFRLSAQDASMLAAEVSLERRTRLTLELTQLARGEAVTRLGHHQVARFRVPTVATVPAITAAELEGLVTPVSRLRSEIEAGLRREVVVPRPNIASLNQESVAEGHHEW